jgi:hypothetical protein
MVTPTVTHHANVRGGTAREDSTPNQQVATTRSSNAGDSLAMTNSSPMTGRLAPSAVEGDVPRDVRLEEVWPVVAPAVRASLIRYGVSPPDAEDIVQNVAEKALRKGVPVVSARAFGRWAVKVAFRQAADIRRARERHPECLDPSPIPSHRPDPAETESAAEARLACQAVLAAVPSLRPRERTTLAGLLDRDARADLDSNVLAQRVWRLRTKLERAVRRTVGLCVAPFVWTHRKGLAATAPDVILASLSIPVLVLSVLATPGPQEQTGSPVFAADVEPADTAQQATAHIAVFAPLPSVLKVQPPTPQPTSQPTPTPTSTRVAVAGPGGVGGYVDKHPNPDDRLICVSNAPNQGDRYCLNRPPLPTTTGNPSGNGTTETVATVEPVP